MDLSAYPVTEDRSVLPKLSQQVSLGQFRRSPLTCFIPFDPFDVYYDLGKNRFYVSVDCDSAADKIYGPITGESAHEAQVEAIDLE